MKIYCCRKKKNLTTLDALLAKELWDKEREEEEARKKKKEWEDTLNLIKTEAKTEADEIIAKALREKEQLEAELERLKQQTAFLSSTDSKLSLNDIEYPDYWEPQSNSHQRFEVYAGSHEFDQVLSTWYNTIGSRRNVRKLYRNQNKSLWTWYYLKKKEVALKNGNNANELTLFHGSRANAVDIILRDGFDIRVAAMSGAIGAGVYFATNSSTSSGYCTVGSNGNMQMLICRVTLGAVTPGKHGLRRPPPKNASKPDVLYDSVSGSGMYVIFDNYQAYPEYLVEFKL